MKPFRLAITAGLGILIWIAPAFGKAWRGITPLRSTRADVERLLGAPEPGTQAVYKSGEDVVRVTYSKIQCDYGWRVGPNTVISVIIYPKVPLKLTELKINEKNYQKRRDLSLENVYYYMSEAEGVNYTVDSVAGVVTAIEYYPMKRDRRLKCALKAKPKVQAFPKTP